MSLVPFTGTVAAAALNSNFDDHRATLTSQAVEGQVDAPIFHRVENLAAAGVSDYVDFTPEDDMEARVLRVYADDATGGQVVKASLEVANGDSTFLLGKTFEKSTGTLAAGVAQNLSLDLRTVTGDRVRLLKGVPYRLRLTRVSGAAGVDVAQVTLLVRTFRRVA